MENKKQITVETEGKKRLDIYLKEITGLSRGKAQKLIDYKNVLVNSSDAVSCHTKVKKGDIIQYSEKIPEGYSVAAADIPVDVIYEDEHILGINKQPGLVVHPAPGHLGDTLVNALAKRFKKKETYFSDESRLGIVHRLDRDTSGVMIIAKNEEAYIKLGQIFRRREIKKIYSCLVHGVIAEEGDININIGRDTAHRKRFAAGVEGGKNARTIFAPEENFYNAVLLNVRILTGRTHQIRVHMKFIKHEVLGDPRYGNKNKDFQILEYLGFDRKSYRDIIPRQMLHAKKVEFSHPFTGEAVVIEAPVPDDISRLTALLGKKKGA